MAMYKIVIVDDEAIERQAIKLMLKQSVHNVSIVGEAKNGREAIQLADTLQPDIMMMDIKMPGISGLEAVQAINKNHPMMKFIMVSAYDTFDYAREAMREGVKEYLLKPSKKDDIILSIQRVTKELAEERQAFVQAEDIKEKFSQALSIMKSEWVMSLLMSHIQEINKEDWLDLLNLNIVNGCAVAINISSETGSLSQEIKQQWYSDMKEWLTRKEDCIVGAMIGEQIPLFLFQQKQMAAPIKALVIKRLQEMRNVFQKKYPKSKLRAGIGRAYQELEELVTSYHEAVLALERVDGEVFYRHFDDLEKHPFLFNDHKLFEEERALLELVKDGEVEQATHLFEAYYEKLRNETTTTNAFIIQQVNDFFVVLIRMIHELGIDTVPQKPLNLGNLDDNEIKDTAIRYLQKLTIIVKGWQNVQDEGLLDKAKSFIECHYFENVTLQMAADHVGLSIYYFSKRFKEHTGLNFIDYLTMIRIEKAKELLRRSDQSLKEICYNIGYKDPNYFSRVFRKMTNMSPSQYRKTT